MVLPSGVHSGSFSSQVSSVRRADAPVLPSTSHRSERPSLTPTTTSVSEPGDQEGKNSASRWRSMRFTTRPSFAETR